MKSYKFQLLALFFVCLSLPACATMPGGVQVTKSEFDGSTHVRGNPGWVGGAGVKLGLSWNSKMPRQYLRLDLLVKDTGIIANGTSLHFNVDGTTVDMAPTDDVISTTIQQPLVNQYVAIPSAVWFSKSYTISPQTVDMILKAKKVSFRIDLTKDYIEGSLLDGPTTAIDGFRRFIEEFEKVSAI